MCRALVGTGDRSERVRTINYAQDRITDHRVGTSVFGVHAFLEGALSPPPLFFSFCVRVFTSVCVCTASQTTA